MRTAVFGASGYTGRLVVAELSRRGIDHVLIGRNRDRLSAAVARPGTELRLADTTAPATLAGVFDGCDAVINCAGPFGVLGEPVIRAAIAAGCHYVDTAGEQHHVNDVFDRFAEPARSAGVTVVPGMADDGGPGDLLGHLTGSAVAPVAALTVGLWYRGGGGSRGSLRSMLSVLDAPTLDYRDGRWIPNPSVGHEPLRFPGREAPVAMSRFGIPPIATIPRHLDVERAEGCINADMVTGLRAVTPELVEAAPEGPSDTERARQRWTHVVEAVGVDGRRARGEIEGGDGYGMTAVIAVEAVRRLVDDGASAGVLAAAQAFDPADFLDTLVPHGVAWRVATG